LNRSSNAVRSLTGYLTTYPTQTHEEWRSKASTGQFADLLSPSLYLKRFFDRLIF